MATRQQAIEIAKRSAARAGKAMLVLNLNRFSSNEFVVRDSEPSLLTSDRVVAVVEADGSVA